MEPKKRVSSQRRTTPTPKRASLRQAPKSNNVRRVSRQSKPSLARASQSRRSASSPVQHRSAIGGNEPLGKRTLKVPEAIPIEKRSAFDKLKSALKRKTAIQEIVREPTSGGIIFRFTADHKDIEILLIQDSKERWTIPKGHIEPGETAKMTARREIEEETGLKNISILTWLGKIHFKYRRLDKLVLMTTQIYLVQALDSHETPTPEKWMKGIQWFSFADALGAIEYDDIEKLMLVAKKKIRAGDY